MEGSHIVSWYAKKAKIHGGEKASFQLQTKGTDGVELYQVHCALCFLRRCTNHQEFEQAGVKNDLYEQLREVCGDFMLNEPWGKAHQNQWLYWY